MSKNLYVGNLSFKVTSDSLRDLFEQYGTVTSASVVMDRDTGRSRGFGFVEMDSGGEAAIDGLNGRDFEGRDADGQRSSASHRTVSGRVVVVVVAVDVATAIRPRRDATSSADFRAI